MEKIEIGSPAVFGGLTWRVLDVHKDAALMITEEIIEQRAYHDAYCDITWAGCGLREYLNGEFYERFNSSDKSRIIQVVNKNPDNPWYGTAGGDDTQDRVFILSLEEAVCKYFGDSGALLYNRREKQRYWFERKDENNHKRDASYKGLGWWWWLRTPGRNYLKAVYIWGGSGVVGIQGNNILKCNVGGPFHPEGDNRGGVRPALWLKI